MLEPIARFSLVSHEGPYKDWPLRTPLLVDGRHTGVSVPGYEIEGQYRCDAGYLLINNWDCPFEESYDFVLLADDFATLSCVSLCVPYGSFLLHAHWPLGEASVRLHFYTSLFYTLHIRPPGRIRRRPRLHLERHLLVPRDDRSRASLTELKAQSAEVRDTVQRDTVPRD
jgi:hypothetical protein